MNSLSEVVRIRVRAAGKSVVVNVSLSESWPMETIKSTIGAELNLTAGSPVSPRRLCVSSPHPPQFRIITVGGAFDGDHEIAEPSDLREGEVVRVDLVLDFATNCLAAWATAASSFLGTADIIDGYLPTMSHRAEGGVCGYASSCADVFEGLSVSRSRGVSVAKAAWRDADKAADCFVEWADVDAKQLDACGRALSWGAHAAAAVSELVPSLACGVNDAPVPSSAGHVTVGRRDVSVPRLGTVFSSGVDMARSKVHGNGAAVFVAETNRAAPSSNCIIIAAVDGDDQPALWVREDDVHVEFRCAPTGGTCPARVNVCDGVVSVGYEVPRGVTSVHVSVFIGGGPGTAVFTCTATDVPLGKSHGSPKVTPSQCYFSVPCPPCGRFRFRGVASGLYGFPVPG